MTEEDKKKDGSIDDLFDETETIKYTDAQMVEYGMLFDVRELSRISSPVDWGKGPFQYVTMNLCHQKGYLRDGEPVQVDYFLDLFRTAGPQIAESIKKKADRIHSATIEFPNGTRGEVYAAMNNSGGFTLMLPDDW